MLRRFVSRHETRRGLAGFAARRVRTVLALAGVARFTVFYFTEARRVRRRHRDAERSGEVLWLDHGPWR